MVGRVPMTANKILPLYHFTVRFPLLRSVCTFPQPLWASAGLSIDHQQPVHHDGSNFLILFWFPLQKLRW